MPNLLMAALLSRPPDPCCFTIFFLVAKFDFWSILWMASLYCYFSHLFHSCMAAFAGQYKLKRPQYSSFG
jgi:hypothetical protein